MRRVRAAVLVLSALWAAGARAGGAVELEGPVLTDMRARLFETKSAQLSDDLLAPGYKGSWNATTGPHASNATLVVVEISGPPGGSFTGALGPGTKYVVSLKARELARTPRVLLDASDVVPVFGDDGKAYVAFLIRPNGCAPVQLVARLKGAKPGKPLERSLDFACGE